MTALAINAAALLALVVAAVVVWRDVKKREAMDKARAGAPVFHINVREVADVGAAVRHGLDWNWTEPCHICAARLVTAAHYVGGGRVVCPDCHALVSRGAA